MKKSNFIAVLKTFDKKEVREFRKWLHSPAHNQREDVIRLYDYLVEENRLEKEGFLLKERAFPWVYPKETYDDAKMRQAIFFLTRTLEEFLIYQELREDEIRSKTILAGVYRKRKLGKAFAKNMRSTRQLQGKQTYQDSYFLQNQYLILREEYAHAANQNRVVPLNLQEVSDALDAYFLAEKLRQACYMQSHLKVFRADYKAGLLEEALRYVEENDLLHLPAISIYYYGLKTTIEPENEENYQQLNLQIANYGHLFPDTEIRSIHLIAINYCIGQLNLGKTEFFRELFEQYRQGLEMGFLIENGILSRYTFRNLVTNGTYLKEFDWVENFIHEYQPYLEERYRESIVHYSLGKLHFEKNDYAKSMQLLSQVEYDDILMNLTAKTMLLKMFYEQDEFDALESLLESMRTYMQRKKVIGYHRSNYKNIIRYTKKLLKVNPYNKAALRRLQEEIKEVNPLTEREWLLRQLERV